MLVEGEKANILHVSVKLGFGSCFFPPHLLVQTEINALICQLFIECLL